MRNLLITTILLLTCINIMAQTSVSIIIRDAYTRQVIPQANISLQGSNGLITTKQSNNTGGCDFNLLINGKYKLLATIIGYHNYQATINIDSLNTPVTIFLTPAVSELRTVNINSTKPYFEMKAGKLIFNAAKSPLASSGSLWEALKYAPTVQSTETGALTVKSQQATVYVDNRRIYLTGDELKQYLQTISASNLDKIEIISNPGAIYPSDIQTIINIKTKNNNLEGIKGSLNSTGVLATFPRYNLSGNLNIKKSIFDAQIGYSHSESKVRETSQYNLLEQDIHPWTVNQLNDTKTTADRAFVNLGIRPNKKSLLLIYSELSPNKSNTKITSDNGLPTNERILAKDSIFRFNSDAHSKINSNFTQITYTNSWDSTRQSINTQIEYYNNNRSLNNLRQTNVFSNDIFNENGYFIDVLPQTVKTFIASTSYNRPFIHGDLVMGLKFGRNQLTNDNSTFYYQLSANTPLLNAASLFKYAENNYAAFTEWSKESGKFQYRFGVRLEDNLIYSRDLNNDLENKTKWVTFFPSALVQWAVSQNNVWVLSYKKNFTRPDYFQLNPFQRFTNNSVADFRGNQAIKPQVNHTLDLSWSDNKIFNISVGGQYIKDFISTIMLKDEQHNLYQQFDNFDVKTVYATLNSTFDPFKFWKVIISSNLAYYDAKYSRIDKVRSTPLVDARYLNVFSLHHDWIIQTSIYYINTVNDGFFQHGSYSSTDLAVQKKIPKSNLTITLSGNDLFKSSTTRDKILYNNIIYNSSSYNDSQLVRLGITWNFGKQTIKTVQKADSESNDVINRVKNQN